MLAHQGCFVFDMKTKLIAEQNVENIQNLDRMGLIPKKENIEELNKTSKANFRCWEQRRQAFNVSLERTMSFPNVQSKDRKVETEEKI